AAFVFCNKAHSRMKVLRWDKHGVWLCLRRLHQGHFIWPKQGDVAWMLSPAQFDWLIKGVDWQRVDGLDLAQWK
ncbi:IS66 family insertion sequence element accessory protein TnpB, partial [Acerihabitans sp. TG2]|uniref:IS66 family insertion sequence element accessory protein TnpB n=1 Tax=Acerihabitans sp. TG2 TaxID=3096008 RepID=UPI002B225432